jgi:polysaccharide biosynthesis transport protein
MRGSGTHLLGADGVPGSAAESYRTLRTALRFIEPDDPLRSLVITSASPGDGKTTTAANLALTLAAAGEQVILADADLRQAGLARLLGLEGSVGMTDVFSGEVPLEDALQPYRDNLWVLPAGALPPNPSEMLGSVRMTTLLEQMMELSDIVLFDAPPILPVTDAVVLSSQVDGTILVTRHRRTTRTQLIEASRRLAAVDADLVGFVYNFQPGRASTAEYGRYLPPAVVTT